MRQYTGDVNKYQMKKARLIAAALLIAACQSDTPQANLSRLVARADEGQWTSLSFAAGVSVADVPCRALVITILEGLA